MPCFSLESCGTGEQLAELGARFLPAVLVERERERHRAVDQSDAAGAALSVESALRIIMPPPLMYEMGTRVALGGMGGAKLRTMN